MRKTTAFMGALLVLAACSGEGGDASTTTTVVTTTTEAPSTTTTAPAATTTTPAPATTTTTQPETASALAIADTSAGSVLVDEAGHTLYLFMSDIDGASTCYGGCETTWPPAPSGLGSGEGVTATLGETTRDDGSTQLTVNDRPVYTYSGDQVPGDVTGQGVGGAWFVIGPDGEPITS